MIYNNSLNHSFTLTVGDIDGDGTDRCRHILYLCNTPWNEVEQLHVVASKLYMIDIETQCSGYDNYYWTVEFYTRLSEIFSDNIKVLNYLNYNLTYDIVTYSPKLMVTYDVFADLYLEIAKLMDSKLSWKKQNSKVPDINIGGSGLF